MLHKTVRTKNLNEPNDPKPAKMTQNQPIRPKKIAKQPGTTQNFEIRIIFNQLLLFSLRVQVSKFGRFGSKSINFLILTKFCVYSISKILISNLTFVFERFQPKFPNLGIMGQKVLIFKYWQNLAYAKSLILTKFCLYPILKVLISSLKIVFEKFLPKFPNLSILDQQTQTF